MFILASVPLLVCPVGLIGIGILTDKIGRRRALQVAYVPNILSWVVLAYANTFETVIIGRVLLGTTIGKFLLTSNILKTNKIHVILDNE